MSAREPGAPSIRVMVVDDSAVLRRLLTEALEATPGIVVVGTAANGKIALERVAALAPDVVTLDQEMPEMNGLETLEALQARYPKLPVIMVSTLTEKAAAVTLMALGRGAADYITKPKTGSIEESRKVLREQLIPRVLAHAPRKLRAALAPAPAPTVQKASARLGPTSRPELIVIGASTGGPSALEHIIPRLPATLDVPILVVQHMPKLFTKLLAARLASMSALPVREAEDGELARPGLILIAPGGMHMTAEGHGALLKVRLNEDAPEHSCRPAVDVLFRSAATWASARTLAVILTGMGQDGLLGCQRIRDGGGQIVAQDEASSVVWGMPGFVARAGIADAIVPLNGIVGEILRRAGSSARPRQVANGA